MSRIIGIDFGTTNTVVSYMDEMGNVRIISDDEGNEMLPSVVAKIDNKLLIGIEAKENVNAFINGDGVKEIKREIGKGKKIRFDEGEVYPSDIAALILARAKFNAEVFLKEQINNAVITVPAEFSDSQRKEIIESAQKAKINVVKIINEPTAALLYHTDKKLIKKRVICYDFGGGTFDVSIADIDYNGVEIIAVGGDRNLGGKEIDDRIFKFLKEDIEDKYENKLDSYGKYQLRLSVEKAKIELSSKEITTISIPALKVENGQIPYYREIHRNEVNNLIKDIIVKTINIVQDTLDCKGLSYEDINEVILVGGSSKMPIVKDELSKKFKNVRRMNPIMEKYVAMGAAIEAANQEGRNLWKSSKIKKDVCPFNLGLKVYRDGIEDVFDPIIFKNSEYGKEFSQKYDTAFDRQNSMKLEIYQGENAVASKNEHIVDFEITGIPEATAGEEWVRVTFKYDENGIITIKAKILSTGFEKSYQRKYGYSLNKKIDTDIVDKNIINSEMKICAKQIADDLEKQGLSSISGKITEHIKYEQGNELQDILNDVLK